MANSKEIIIQNKEFRRIKTSSNITTTLKDDDIEFDLAENITSTAKQAKNIEFEASTEKAYLLGTKSTTSGQKPVYCSSVYTSNGAIYANAFYGNGNGLTNINPANISEGTANISSSKVGFTIDNNTKSYLLGTTSTVADGNTTGYIKPNYNGNIYMQGDTLHSPKFIGDGSGLWSVSSEWTKNYDASEGNIKDKFNDIETRLNNLGFNEGVITKSSSAYVFISNSTLTKLGNYVIGKFDVKCGYTNIGTIPYGFRPYIENTINIYIRETSGSGYNYVYTPATMTFKTTGEIVVSYSNPSDNVKTIIFGWDTTAGIYQ